MWRPHWALGRIKLHAPCVRVSAPTVAPSGQSGPRQRGDQHWLWPVAGGRGVPALPSSAGMRVVTQSGLEGERTPVPSWVPPGMALGHTIWLHPARVLQLLCFRSRYRVATASWVIAVRQDSEFSSTQWAALLGGLDAPQTADNPGRSAVRPLRNTMGQVAWATRSGERPDSGAQWSAHTPAAWRSA